MSAADRGRDGGHVANKIVTQAKPLDIVRNNFFTVNCGDTVYQLDRGKRFLIIVVWSVSASDFIQGRGQKKCPTMRGIPVRIQGASASAYWNIR